MSPSAQLELDSVLTRWRRHGMTAALFIFNVGLYLHIALTLYRGHA